MVSGSTSSLKYIKDSKANPGNLSEPAFSKKLSIAFPVVKLTF